MQYICCKNKNNCSLNFTDVLFCFLFLFGQKCKLYLLYLAQFQFTSLNFERKKNGIVKRLKTSFVILCTPTKKKNLIFCSLFLLLSLSPFFSPIATNGPFSNNCLNNKAQPLNQTLGQLIFTTYLSQNRPPSMPPANLFMTNLDGGGVRESKVEFLFHFPPPPSKLVISNHFNNPNLYQITITLSTFKPQ